MLEGGNRDIKTSLKVNSYEKSRESSDGFNLTADLSSRSRKGQNSNRSNKPNLRLPTVTSSPHIKINSPRVAKEKDLY